MAAITPLYTLGFDLNRNIYFIVWIAIYSLVISLPMLKHIADGSRDDVDENRNLADFPTWENEVDGIKNYTDGMSEYLSDHFGFRPEMITTYNQILFHLFRQTTSKRITIGKNGFIFLNSHYSHRPFEMLDNVCNITPKSLKKQNSLSDIIYRFVDYYRNKGFVTDFAVIPTKSRIYAEKLPAHYISNCGTKEQTWLEKSISNVTGVNVYYPIKTFRGLKEKVDVYLPTYFHWNGELPYIIATDMMEKLWGIEPEFDLDGEEVEVESDLKSDLKGLNFIENSIKYTYKNIAGIDVCRGPDCIENLTNHYRRGIALSIKNSNNKNQSRLLIFNDSFGNQIAKHFVRGFSQVHSISLNKLKPSEYVGFFDWVEQKIKPTHVLYLVHDDGLHRVANRLDKYLLKQKY